MTRGRILRETPHPAFPGVVVRVTVEDDDSSPFEDLFGNRPGTRYHNPGEPYMDWRRPTGDERGRSVKVEAGRNGPLGDDAWYVAAPGESVDRPGLREWLRDVAYGYRTNVVVSVEAIFNGTVLCGDSLGGVEIERDEDVESAVRDYGLTPDDTEIARGLRGYIEDSSYKITRARAALGV